MNARTQSRRGGLQAPVLTALSGIFLALTLLVPSASAAGVINADVSLSRLHASSGTVTESGNLDLLYIHRTDPDTYSNLPILTLTGAKINATVYTASGYVVPGGAPLDPACQEPFRSMGVAVGCPTHVTKWGTAATVHLQALQPDWLVNMFGDDVKHVASYSSADVTEITDPQISNSGIHPALGASSNTNEEDWTLRHVPAGHVVSEPSTGVATVSLDGDFVIEVRGADFIMSDASGSQSLHSGVDDAPLAPGAPTDVETRTQHFLRLKVTGGHMDLVLTHPTTQVAWAAPGTILTTAGSVYLDQASGTVASDDGTTANVRGQTVNLDGAYKFTLQPKESGLTTHVARIEPSTAVVQPDSGLSSILAWAFAAIASVLIVLGAAVVLLGRRSRTPILADVEAAIEAGHFRRAAADAGRILRRRPDMEDALLSRAIALCKAGKPARVVRELRAHLAARRPTDGSLHYVLGLAYLDLAQRAQAEAVFQEAVARTPALLTDVQAKLGPAGTTSRTPTPVQGVESTHGYA